MPVRYIGREPFHKGKTLYEICRQLANAGEGRIVYRQKHADQWPTQKSFFKLTTVIPDKTCTDCRKGEAWGIRVFRGAEFGESIIGSGHKADWRLVPKHMEEEFCRITDVWPVPKQPPSHIPAPPWLNLLLQKDSVTSINSEKQEPLMVPLTGLLKTKPRKGQGS